MKIELIYQDEKSNKFWTIEVNGNEHTVTYGRIDSKGVSKTKTFTDNEEATKNATKLADAKKKKGYQEVSAATTTPLAAAAPINVPPSTSPRLIQVRNDDTFADKSVANFTANFDPRNAIKVLSDYDEELKVVDKLEILSNLSRIAEMDTLIIGAWQEAHDANSYHILDKLIELKDKFSGLKHLFIGDMDGEECEMSWIIQAKYEQFYQFYPALETFGTRGGEGLELGNINLPNLKHLIIESGGISGDVIDDILKSNLPNLEHLEIWLGTDEYGCSVTNEQLKKLLHKNFPNLRYLGLKNYYQSNELAQQLNGAPILNKIQTLDLSMGTLTDKGAEALYNNDDLLKLVHLNCRHHYISETWQTKLKEKFKQQAINLADAEQADEYDDEVYYYVEIGE